MNQLYTAVIQLGRHKHIPLIALIFDPKLAATGCEKMYFKCYLHSK